MHVMHMMQTKDTLLEVEEESTPLSRLVYGDADVIMKEFETLLSPSSWEFLSLVPDPLRGPLTARVAVLVVLTQLVFKDASRVKRNVCHYNC